MLRDIFIKGVRTFQPVTHWPRKGYWAERLGRSVVVLGLLMAGIHVWGTDWSSRLVVASSPYGEKVERNIVSLEEVVELPAVPELSTEIYLVGTTRGEILLDSQIDMARPPASTTKMMTALIAVDTYALDETLVVPSNFNVIGSQVGLFTNEQILVENALYGLLLSSGNDIAELLAISHPQGRDEYIRLMNVKAEELGMATAQFRNPSGLDETGHIMSARDLFILGQSALKNQILSRIVSTSRADIYEMKGHYLLENKNELLNEDLGVTGIKTGWTEEAGEVLVTSLERGEQTFIIVVMGSENRFEDTRKLIGWVDELLALSS